MVFSMFSVAVLVCLFFGEPLVNGILEADATSVQQRGSRQTQKKPELACPEGEINVCEWTDGNNNHPGEESYCSAHCNRQQLSSTCKNKCTCSCQNITCIGREQNTAGMRRYCINNVIQNARVSVDQKNTCDCAIINCTKKQSCVDVKL